MLNALSVHNAPMSMYSLKCMHVTVAILHWQNVAWFSDESCLPYTLSGVFIVIVLNIIIGYAVKMSVKANLFHVRYITEFWYSISNATSIVSFLMKTSFANTYKPDINNWFWLYFHSSIWSLLKMKLTLFYFLYYRLNRLKEFFSLSHTTRLASCLFETVMQPENCFRYIVYDIHFKYWRIYLKQTLYLRSNAIFQCTCIVDLFKFQK